MTMDVNWSVEIQMTIKSIGFRRGQRVNNQKQQSGGRQVRRAGVS